MERLAEVLVLEKKDAEAERWLQDLQVRLQKEPPEDAVSRIYGRLAGLYTRWDKPEQAAEWNRKLVEFDQAEAAKKTAAHQP